MKFNLLNYLENLAKKYQLKVMKNPQGKERIKEGALYFHPRDYRDEVLKVYTQKVKRLSST